MRRPRAGTRRLRAGGSPTGSRAAATIGEDPGADDVRDRVDEARRAQPAELVRAVRGQDRDRAENRDELDHAACLPHDAAVAAHDPADRAARVVAAHDHGAGIDELGDDRMTGGHARRVVEVGAVVPVGPVEQRRMDGRVDDQDGLLRAGRQPKPEVARIVPGQRPGGHPGSELGVRANRVDPALLDERRSRPGSPGTVECSIANASASPWTSTRALAYSVLVREPADVIDVEVAQEDRVQLGGLDTVSRERRGQPALALRLPVPAPGRA